MFSIPQNHVLGSSFRTTGAAPFSYPTVCIACYGAVNRELPPVCTLSPCLTHQLPIPASADHAQIRVAVAYICRLLVAARAPLALMTAVQTTALALGQPTANRSGVARFTAALAAAHQWFRSEVTQ